MSKQTEISSALDRLQQFAGDLINMETARRIQLGKEKEARVAEAYKYLMSREESKINQHETAIDSLTQNLMDRGIELKSVKDEYKTVASEELLSAANESAISMLDVMLNDAKMQEQSWRSRLRDVQSVARHVDLFDDAMKMVNPAATGDQHKIEAGDVAEVATKFLDTHDKYAPEIEQRLKELQTEGQLERLQEDYIARLARDVEEKKAIALADKTDSILQLEDLKNVKQQSLEGVKALTDRPLFALNEQFGAIITRQVELQDPDLTTSAISELETEIGQEQIRLASILFPWDGAKNLQPDVANRNAGKVQMALISALKNQNYVPLIEYLKEGQQQYNMMTPGLAEQYKQDLLSMTGIDISNTEHLRMLIQFNENIYSTDIKEAEIFTKRSEYLLPQVEVEDEEQDPLLKQFFGE